MIKCLDTGPICRLTLAGGQGPERLERRPSPKPSRRRDARRSLSRSEAEPWKGSTARAGPKPRASGHKGDKAQDQALLSLSANAVTASTQSSGRAAGYAALARGVGRPQGHHPWQYGGRAGTEGPQWRLGLQGISVGFFDDLEGRVLGMVGLRPVAYAYRAGPRHIRGPTVNRCRRSRHGARLGSLAPPPHGHVFPANAVSPSGRALAVLAPTASPCRRQR